NQQPGEHPAVQRGHHHRPLRRLLLHRPYLLSVRVVCSGSHRHASSVTSSSPATAARTAAAICSALSSSAAWIVIQCRLSALRRSISCAPGPDSVPSRTHFCASGPILRLGIYASSPGGSGRSWSLGRGQCCQVASMVRNRRAWSSDATLRHASARSSLPCVQWYHMVSASAPVSPGARSIVLTTAPSLLRSCDRYAASSGVRPVRSPNQRSSGLTLPAHLLSVRVARRAPAREAAVDVDRRRCVRHQRRAVHAPGLPLLDVDEVVHDRIAARDLLARHDGELVREPACHDTLLDQRRHPVAPAHRQLVQLLLAPDAHAPGELQPRLHLPERPLARDSVRPGAQDQQHARGCALSPARLHVTPTAGRDPGPRPPAGSREI